MLAHLGYYLAGALGTQNNSRTGASPRVGTEANVASLSAVQPGCLRISATIDVGALGTRE